VDVKGSWGGADEFAQEAGQDLLGQLARPLLPVRFRVEDEGGGRCALALSRAPVTQMDAQAHLGRITSPFGSRAFTTWFCELELKTRQQGQSENARVGDGLLERDRPSTVVGIFDRNLARA
jgi:hypothetical protein